MSYLLFFTGKFGNPGRVCTQLDEMIRGPGQLGNVTVTVKRRFQIQVCFRDSASGLPAPGRGGTVTVTVRRRTVTVTAKPEAAGRRYVPGRGRPGGIDLGLTS